MAAPEQEHDLRAPLPCCGAPGLSKSISTVTAAVASAIVMEISAGSTLAFGADYARNQHRDEPGNKRRTIPTKAYRDHRNEEARDYRQTGELV
ncbi:hypothetical protein JQU17_08500 [Ponticoccus sp. SC2-23]|uniref:hypothetical protein n=1 Tax=Alexandriicola marinus TaxID=2081710 RepID=UPI000FDAA9A2|nr:hypothetical protein [Alexandriicola marinus]MBM1220274.1 hypothetical protein [Ponticoccus sp. SC6-9]MBM1224960.1 hypothetical protein [Ponticoccus sp. SC6-15]MBM1228474.1 hypothetical protein [Ponticoccus sp. SC6-38]MBM1233889.1 hypothetical protein [Ponticoccus sp. SC6-45]MBM1238975.1 hypothetical protein [Ponticoccus sp. SC6-49]MBM1242757.1 hypothetical protein [Ponticoccus sp. SC2-64]MBM1247413.1 hypothetical protein [Ponticoccus sp. SC6-42]MBM1251928.1 hypothetical protein [Pontico